MSAARQSEPILLIEDDDDEALLLQRALERNQAVGPVIRLTNGFEAVKYLNRTPPYGDAKVHPLPRLIITDLQMPLMDGFEVVAAVRIHAQCSVVPIIIMSNSSQEDHIHRAYQLGANSYIVKPQKMEELVRVIGLSMQYWKMCAKPDVGY
jgi:DNA-binding response OmpR family regulator